MGVLTVVSACGWRDQVLGPAPAIEAADLRSFDRRAAEAAAAAAADAARAGRSSDAVGGYAAALEFWPVDATLWRDLAAQYRALDSADGDAYARFFAARVDTLNALHPRAAASAIAGVAAPQTVTDPRLVAAYAESGRLIATFYRSRYEEVRAERTRTEQDAVWVYQPYLAYPAAVLSGLGVGATFYQFARGLGQDATQAAR